MSTEQRQALAELVALDDLDHRIENWDTDSGKRSQLLALQAEYERRKPLALAAARAALASTPEATAVPASGVAVFLVATGETHEGLATHTRHESAPPPLCDFEGPLFATQSTAEPAAVPVEPIDMVLHCPECGTQHIDGMEEHEVDRGLSTDLVVTWTNPPHRSHLCHACEHIWRPADVPTNGVQAVKTAGKADSPIAAQGTQKADTRVEELEAELDAKRAELDEALHQPWPEWAKQVLKMTREMSGYDGYDDQDGIDVAEEVREAYAELTSQIERLRATPAIDLHPATVSLVDRFAVSLKEKLAAAEKKYGYSDGWASPDWMDECRAHLMEHINKGDPRDVAAYCAFLWHHGASTAAPQNGPQNIPKTIPATPPKAEATQAAEIERLRGLAATCYAGLGAEHNLPETWLDVLNAAANGEPFDASNLLPYTATQAAAGGEAASSINGASVDVSSEAYRCMNVMATVDTIKTALSWGNLDSPRQLLAISQMLDDLARSALTPPSPAQSPEQDEEEFIPTNDFLGGHQCGLEWAACMVEANDPRTGDWLHDDRQELADAIRKGPEMPEPSTPPQAAQAMPHGWKLVPIEPTPEMLAAGAAAFKAYAARWMQGEPAVYAAMLAASPQGGQT